MKTKFTLLALSLFCFMKPIFSQTIPIGFTNQKAFPIPLSGIEKTNKTLLTQGGTKTKYVSVDASNYVSLAQRLESNADSVERVIAIAYQANFGKLDISNTDALNANIKALNDKRSADMKQVSAARKAAKGYRYLARTANNFNFFFVKDAIDAEMYYNGTLSDNKAKFLSNSLLAFSSDGGKASIYNEIYADYYGPIRVGFGALISNKQTPSTTTPDPNETKNDAVQRLLGGGGNGVFSFSYPILDVQSKNAFFVKLAASPKLALDVPKIGTDNSAYAVNYNLGVEGSIFYTGALNVLTFYTNFRFAQLAGNGLFYDNLTKTDHKSFNMNQLSFGFAITSTFRLSYNYYFGDGFVTSNFPQTISFTIIPQ